MTVLYERENVEQWTYVIDVQLITCQKNNKQHVCRRICQVSTYEGPGFQELQHKHYSFTPVLYKRSAKYSYCTHCYTTLQWEKTEFRNSSFYAIDYKRGHRTWGLHAIGLCYCRLGEYLLYMYVGLVSAVGIEEYKTELQAPSTRTVQYVHMYVQYVQYVASPQALLRWSAVLAHLETRERGKVMKPCPSRANERTETKDSSWRKAGQRQWERQSVSFEDKNKTNWAPESKLDYGLPDTLSSWDALWGICMGQRWGPLVCLLRKAHDSAFSMRHSGMPTAEVDQDTRQLAQCRWSSGKRARCRICPNRCDLVSSLRT